MTPTTIADACRALQLAKAAENAATANRLHAEQDLLALVGILPAEGTTRREDGGYVAVIQSSIRRNVDSEKLAEIAAQIPEEIGKRLIRWKPELETRELRFVQSNEPQIYAIVAQAIEAKPAKPSVRVELAKQAAA
jgi:hypothetical protein